MADQEYRAELNRGQGGGTGPQDAEVAEEEEKQEDGGRPIGERGRPVRCREECVVQALGGLRRSHHPIDHRSEVLDPAVGQHLALLESREERVVVLGKLGAAGRGPATGSAELSEYYNSFLAGLQIGRAHVGTPVTQ